MTERKRIEEIRKKNYVKEFTEIIKMNVKKKELNIMIELGSKDSVKTLKVNTANRKY